MTGRKSPTLSLAYFLNRSQVLKQYRSFMREIQPLAKDTRQEVRLTIRSKFEAAKNEKNNGEIKKHLAYGHSQMQHVRELVNSVSSTPIQSIKNSDTWIDINEDTMNESHEDIKGRIGKGWPWSR